MRTVDPAVVAYWSDLARRLQAAAGDGARGDLIDGAGRAWGISRNAVYSRLRQFGGWTSGRKRRADAGRTKLDPDALDMVAALQRESTRVNGKRLMSIELAASIAAGNGIEVPVSVSQVGRLLRAHRLDARGQGQATARVRMRSEHPNHVHMVDPSLCVLFYLRGEQHLLREQEFYKNKLDKLAKIKNKVWRYVRTDHASSLIDVWYVEAPGESAANLGEFLIRTWSKRDGITGHGAPRLLVTDPGSANTAAPIRGLLDALDVELYAHGPEMPWVKGQVEGANNIIERQFESRLRFEPVGDVDGLNCAAQTWVERYNRNGIARQDTRLRRPGQAPIARADLWLRITAAQLREIPEPAVCRRFLAGRRVERRVSQHLAITYPHPAAPRAQSYDLRGCPGVHPGDLVSVAPLIVPEAGESYPIRVHWTGPAGQTGTWRIGADVEVDQFGIPLSAPVWREEYRPHSHGEAAEAGKRLDRAAYPAQTAPDQPGRDVSERARRARQAGVTPFGGELRAHSLLADGPALPTVLPRRGQPIAPADPEAVAAEAPLIPLVTAFLRLAEAWGRPVSREENQFLRARYPAGVPEDELSRLAAAATVAPQTPAAVLRVVGER